MSDDQYMDITDGAGVLVLAFEWVALFGPALICLLLLIPLPDEPPAPAVA